MRSGPPTGAKLNLLPDSDPNTRWPSNQTRKSQMPDRQTSVNLSAETPSVITCKHRLKNHTTSPAAQHSASLLLFLVSTPTTQLKGVGGGWRPGSSHRSSRALKSPVVGQSGVRWDSYPGFLGSLSRDELPPFSLRTSFSLLRRIDARSLLKEPLLFREPEPS